MLTVVLYRDDVLEGVGYPNYYLTNEDFCFVVTDADARHDFIRHFGEGVCVGPLGRETADGFVDEDPVVDLPKDSLRKGDFSYYGKL